MALTLDQIKLKYGYEMTWTEGQASGTDFSRSHRPFIIDRLKRGIEGALHRRRIFGPCLMVWYGQDKQTEPNFRNNKGLRRKGGIGRYLATDLEFGGTWDTDLTDVLFDVNVVFPSYANPAGVEERVSVKGLKFPTLSTFIEFADTFLDENNKYSRSIVLEAYWLEDETLPAISKCYAWNAFFAALTGGAGGDGLKNGIVDALAFDGGTPPAGFLETALQAIWTAVWGGPIPPYGSMDEFRRLFWCRMRSRGKNRYRAAHRLAWEGISPRRMSDFTAGRAIIPALGLSTEGTGLFFPLQLNVPGWAIGPANSRDWMKQGPLTQNSQIYVGQIEGSGVTPADYKAVAIHAQGVDSMVIPWQDPNTYSLQVVQDAIEGATSRMRIIENPCATETAGYERSRVLHISDWCFTGAATRSGYTQGSSRMRWQMKGTPFVGPLSPWAIKGLREDTRRLDGYIVE